MGLAEPTGPNTWRVRQDFENVLRAMQRSADRQKMLAAHGVLMSDERLQLAVLDLRSLTTLEGRILVHGEEETGRQAGRSYLMLEGTDGRVHYVYYTPEMEAARNRGGLRTNSFVRLRKLFAEGRPALEDRRVGRFGGDLAQQAIPSRDSATSYPARNRSSRGRLEWMARSLSEGASGDRNDSRPPTPYK